MTQKDANILVEIITKVVRKELGIFKKQLLQEGYTTKQVVTPVSPQPTNKLTEVHKNFRKSFKSNSISQNNKPLSKDPLLNSLLQETISIEEAERQAEELAMLEGVNLPVDANGRIISSNANVDHVLEAMNRDYSDMFKPKQGSKPSAPVSANSQLRSDFMALMEEENPPSRQNKSNISAYPSVEPFPVEEEDFSFLNGVS